jgi:hypothetical protein
MADYTGGVGVGFGGDEPDSSEDEEYHNEPASRERGSL